MKFPKELTKQYWPKTIPVTTFAFSKVFKNKGIQKELDSFNLGLPKPYGERIVLSKEQESELFLKFNYAKYRASLIVHKSTIKKWLAKATYYEAVIVHHNISLAYSWAIKSHKFGARTEISFMDEDEVEAEAIFGFYNAIIKFDVDRGFKFSTFAKFPIQTAVFGQRRKNEKHDHAELFTRKNEVIKDKTNIPRIDAAIDVEQMVFSNDELLKSERNVLSKLFGLRGGEVNLLREVADEFGVTKQRIQQIKVLTLKKIRNKFEQAAIL